MTNTELSPFVSQTLVYLISLPPSSLNNIKGGIVASLHTSVLKYDPRLPGVLISFKDISFTRDKCIGTILNENSWINFKIECSGTVFKPKVGAVLSGKVNKATSGHCGLLIYNMFNASIPESALRAKGYEFVEGEGGEGEEEGVWRGEDGGRIGVGSLVQLKCVKIHALEGVLSIEGKLA